MSPVMVCVLPVPVWPSAAPAQRGPRFGTTGLCSMPRQPAMCHPATQGCALSTGPPPLHSHAKMVQLKPSRTSVTMLDTAVP